LLVTTIGEIGAEIPAVDIGTSLVVRASPYTHLGEKTFGVFMIGLKAIWVNLLRAHRIWIALTTAKVINRAIYVGAHHVTITRIVATPLGSKWANER
jgi:hypothetical protein